MWQHVIAIKTIMAEESNREHFNNFISVAVSLKVTIFGLQDYVLETLKGIHQDVYRKCAIWPKCNIDCSRKYKNRFYSWCDTCKAWKKELHKFNSLKSHWDKIKWEQIDTGDFPLSFEHMAKVFIRDFQCVRQGYLLQDLSSLMSLFKNLKTIKVNVDDRTIDGVLRIRNQNYGHNYQLRLFGPEKRQSILCLKELLKVTQIANTKSAKESIADLALIEVSGAIPIAILRKYSLENIVTIQDDYLGKVELYLNEDIRNETFQRVMNTLQISEEYDIQETEEEIQNLTATSYCFNWSWIIVIAIMMIIYIASSYLFTQPLMDNKKIGCMSMRFDEYWKSDLDFDFYVEDLNNQSIITRQWLQDLLLEKIKISTRGIILTAGMGYGKSSFISNLICAEKSSDLQELRQFVLAYHMCRYDVKLSLKPDIFIRNLAGKLVKTIPEVGNAILSDDRALDFLYSMKCAEDPISCAEFAIFNPLKNLPKDQIYLIVIDALDECYEPGINNLVTLIYRKMVSFPYNIKFVFTSRNIEQVLNKFKELDLINLHSFEDLCAKDLQTYIEQSLELDQEQIDKLTDESSGNFLYIKLKLQYCREIGLERCNNVPENLEKIYSLNFERVFGEKGELFDQFIQLFEVLCSLQNPIEEETLYRIAGFGNGEKARKASKIIGNELGHFIKFSLNRISFQHKSLSDFLTNSSRKHLPFYVNKQNGHRLFASYLLESLNLTQNDNIVEIVHHVALTGETKYEEMLFSYASQWEMGRIENNYTYLYEAAREVNDYNTLKMFIRLVTFYGINNMDNVTFQNEPLPQKKDYMSVAAFIAASHGNEESLRALLDFGATSEYKNCYNCIIYHHPLNALYICRYELFCGYTYMHIAAQRGHIKVVQYLINKTPGLLYEKNKLNLTAFQLAAEHGHVLVMEVMLKFNKTLADQHSLYYASQNGHVMAVNTLLQYTEDICLKCNRSTHLRNSQTKYYYDNSAINIHISNQSNDIHISNQANDDIIYDDWRLFTCDTALHAATRNGYFQIVTALVNKSKVAMECELFDGSTPLMTAIKFNRSEIFKFLYQTGANHSHICTGISEKKLDVSKLFPYEFVFFVKSACPTNGNVAHLIGIYDNIEIIQFLLDKGHKSHTFWNLHDATGNTPLHYAFCHNSYNFIRTILFKKSVSLNVSARTNNGSTPFHSAAICKSSMLHRYFTSTRLYSFNEVPDILDNLNRSILQYGLHVLVDSDDQTQIDQIGRDEFTYRLFEVILTCNHNLLNIDGNNRNFLHYAAQSGNFWAFILISDKPQFLKKTDLMSLLFQRDIDGRIPFEVAFDALPERKSFEPIKVPHNCSLNQVFFETCKTNYSILLSPHEHFIFILSVFFNLNRNFAHINLTDLVIISIKKSRLYPILILKTYAEGHFNAISNSTEVTRLVSDSSIPFIAELILDIDSSLQCNGVESPLHNVIQNDRNSRWRFSSFAVLDPLFKKYHVNYLDNCYDKEGYNLLHRSVMGGNTQTFLYLISKGLNLWTRSKKNESVLEIGINKSPFMTNGSLSDFYNTGYIFHVLQFVLQSEKGQPALYAGQYDVNFDETLAQVFDQMENSNLLNRTQLKESLCTAGSKTLGLIHTAAAKGLLIFLKRVKNIYGIDILDCADHYGITPLFLASLYDQVQVMHWLKGLNFKLTKPVEGADKILIYNILDNYSLKQNLDWICFLRYESKYLYLIKHTLHKCIKKILHSFILRLVETDLKNVTASILNQFFYYNNKDIRRTERNLIKCWKTSYTYHVYDLLNLLILFGFDDKEYHYKKLVSETISLKSTSLKPLTRHEYKSLFAIVFDDKYSHLNILKMREELHEHWLKQRLSANNSDLLQHVQAVHSFSLQQIHRIERIMFPFELDSHKGALNKVCVDLLKAVEKEKEAVKSECALELELVVDSLHKQLLFINTNEQLHDFAYSFYHDILVQGLSPSAIACHYTHKIILAYTMDTLKHKVIELETLMKRTLRKISRLTREEKKLFHMASFKKYLYIIISKLSHFYEYEDMEDVIC